MGEVPLYAPREDGTASSQHPLPLRLPLPAPARPSCSPHAPAPATARPHVSSLALTWPLSSSPPLLIHLHRLDLLEHLVILLLYKHTTLATGMGGMAEGGHPGGNPEGNLKSISHTCHPILVAFAWELSKETIHLPLGCLQGGCMGGESPRYWDAASRVCVSV